MSDGIDATRSALGRDWDLFYDNSFFPSDSGRRIPVYNPATGEKIGSIADASEADVDRMVASSVCAQQSWAKVPVGDRIRMLGEVASLIEERAEEIAWLDSVDNGSPLAMMRNDVKLAVRQLRYLAGLGHEVRGDVIPTGGHDSLDYVMLQPFGVVGRIIPFNHPFMFAVTKSVAPLVTGNTVILKPSQTTPLSAIMLGEIFAEVFPPGVVNVLTGGGSRAGDALVRHPDVARIAFTGSVEVGLAIQRSAATSRVKTVTLELGGKNPLIVFPDADLDAAVAGAVAGMNFTWQGQSCGSTSRLYVHRTLWEPFVEAMGQKLRAIKVGDPLNAGNDMGSLVSREHRATVSSFIAKGIADPTAVLVAGGAGDAAASGSFIEPTMFAWDDPDARSPLIDEEIFGPVVVAIPFDSYDAVIHEANRLDVGLTASVWTNDLGLAMRATRDLRAGYVWVNESGPHLPGTPYGGIGNSGLGREEGVEELYSYVQPKNVYINFPHAKSATAS